MMKNFPILKLLALLLLSPGVLSIAGCFPVHPYFDSYTRTEPVKSEVIGSYKASSQKLILLSDGNFVATGIPTSSTDTNTRVVNGRWKINSYTLSKGDGGGKVWRLLFTQGAVQAGNNTLSPPFPREAALLNHSKPYDILFEYDVEGDHVVLLEKY